MAMNSSNRPEPPWTGRRAPMARTGAPIEGIRFNDDHKYDFQLSASLIAERRLAEIYNNAAFMNQRNVRIELKTETWQWEKTGNICIEYRCDGRPSGLSTTRADIWVHELRRGPRGREETLVYHHVPIPRMKDLARRAIRSGRCRKRAGDGGRFHVALIPLTWLAGLDAV